MRVFLYRGMCCLKSRRESPDWSQKSKMIFDKDDQIGTIFRMKVVSCTVRYDPQSQG